MAYHTQLTEAEKERFAEYLKSWFPWLGTDEEDIAGSDTIMALDEMYIQCGGKVETDGMNLDDGDDDYDEITGTMFDDSDPPEYI